MNGSAIGKSYARSLLWVALFIGITLCVKLIVELIALALGSPEPRQDMFCLIALVAPIAGIVAAIAALLVFTLPQIFQALLIGEMKRRFGERGRFAVVFALPLTAVLTWYCYDYLLHDLVSPFDYPYQHGISPAHYLKSLACQAPVTLFGLLHFDAGLRGRRRKPLLLAVLAIAIVSGAIWGYVRALLHQDWLL